MSKYKIGDKVENIILEDHTVFQKELDLISNKKLRNFVAEFLDTKVPKYFYHIPASSSGKYHPVQDLGTQGLIRHTKAVVQVALDLLRSEMFVNDCDYFRDMIISACLLHDTFKNGLEEGCHTVSNHPLLASESILKAYESSTFEDSYCMIEGIRECVESHMGKWNTDKETGEVILPKPESEAEQLVHMADYIASRKYIDMSQLED